MSERSERLFEALSEIDEQKIDEAAPGGRTGRFHWKRWAALAAALALVIGAGSYVLPRLGMGDSASNGGAGGAGADGASTFMSYAGPVFPLTLKEADSEITAQREITMDIQEWTEWISTWGMRVTDAYTLTNTSEEDRTVSLLYPFVSSLQEVWKHQPALTADGQELEAILHAGPYAGGFQGADGGGGGPLLNLKHLHSWEEYRTLLSDGRYQEKALGDYPDLSDIPVTVYRFFDSYGPEPDSKAGIPNPSIRAYFDLDYDKTTVLSYGFHAASYDQENGKMIQGFSIRQSFNPDYGNPYYLIVVGEDIRNLTTRAYVTGGTDADTKELDNAGVNMERYTTDLDTVLREVTRLMYDSHIKNYAQDDFRDLSGVDYEMYHGLLKEFLVSYGVLSEDGPERYDRGWLESLDVANVDRVFYLEAAITIPAGGSVTVAADMHKDPSYDFFCAHTENQGVHGYDMVTRLGSNLVCTAQTAVLVDSGQFEIVRQNFGFDLENGITRVVLDPDQEHYYLEVKKLEPKS